MHPLRRTRTQQPPHRLASWLLLIALPLMGVACSTATPAAQERTAPSGARSVATAAAWPATPGVGAAAQTLVGSGSLDALRWPRFGAQRAELQRLYARAHGEPLWLAGSVPTLAARQLIARFQAADSLGLEPADYDGAWLAAQSSALASGPRPAPAADQARFDAALSVAAVRFVSALHRGRVSPRVVHAQLFIPRDSLAIEMVVDSLRDVRAQSSLLTRVQPQLLHYQLLKNGLARYRALTLDSTLVPLPAMARVVKPGMPLRSAVHLRHLLVATGDLPPVPGSPAAESLYTGDLVEGVKRFQLRQGYKADGIIGPATLARLDRPFEQRVRQIELVLERFRWLPVAFSSPPVIVNIPAFRLYTFPSALDQEHEMLAMDVVVGGSFNRHTPVFAADMKYLIFRPYWEVPQSIMRAEIAPKARRDANYLDRERMVLVSGESERSPALPATAANIARIGRGLRVRQLPGPENSLGLVKFIMPNAFNIYLHDTPGKAAFDKQRRDVSHGCIRLSDPVALAVHVLRSQGDWNESSVRAAMEGTDNHRVNLQKAVPVCIVYATAIAKEDGSVLFYNDVYGLDAELDALLTNGYPYPR